MHRTIRGRGVARAPIALLVLAFAAGCGDGRQSAAPGSAGASAVASPAASQRLPTPVPTPEPTSGEPTPGASAEATGRLLLRLTTCSHTCDATPGTTFLDDGRLLWEAIDGSGQVLEARLSAAGLAKVRAAIEATPALAADGAYQATLRPGAEPIPHGVREYRFDVQWAGGPVLVTSWDPESLADQAELWIFPPEMAALDDLATRLEDPVAWLGEAAFETAPAPYIPSGMLVRIDLFPDIGDVGGVAADVDDVDWPFGEPIEAAGEPIAGEDLPAPRCVVLDADEAAALRDAEREAGVPRDPRLWQSVVDYGWDRADGFAQVTVRQLLPYQMGTCEELLAEAP